MRSKFENMAAGRKLGQECGAGLELRVTLFDCVSVADRHRATGHHFYNRTLAHGSHDSDIRVKLHQHGLFPKAIPRPHPMPATTRRPIRLSKFPSNTPLFSIQLSGDLSCLMPFSVELKLG